jgi:hypothetical protein
MKHSITKTGNIAVDMIYACLEHYKQHRKKVQYVNLDKLYWIMFTEWMKRHAPEKPFTDDGIQFNNTIIRKGHRFMGQHLEVEFVKEETAQA